MNKNIKTLGTALLMAMSLSSMAQKSVSKIVEDKDGKVKIHIETEDNGNLQVFENTYDTKGMSELDKENLINRISDSLLTKNSGDRKVRRKMRIRVDGDTEGLGLVAPPQPPLPDDLDLRLPPLPDDLEMRPPSAPRAPKAPKHLKNGKKGTFRYKNDKGQTFEKDLNFDQDFTFNFDDLDKLNENFNHDELIGSLRPMIKNFKRGRGQDFMAFRDNGDEFNPFMSNESKTVKALRVYPNNPFNSKLNIKFVTPEKGDVTITITDVTGKEVGTEKIKDFQGEYLGQIEVKKNAKGTLFVTVVQGEDGTVKRVVVE